MRLKSTKFFGLARMVNDDIGFGASPQIAYWREPNEAQRFLESLVIINKNNSFVNNIFAQRNIQYKLGVVSIYLRQRLF